ncbi:peptidoglycan DD-metalloendopeptidase family protein [Catellatospora sp. KI3]|uniref:peptidoglycan DD-metalloendopeptidase family protein n=1 Tax=Catellatospora sp. KI3 TaxID=3041620 RepID=UPI0024828307|nr:peptidoglycan DD-metalloendopeptidase family protein [Catellatospora sp. KI3]MDI1463726.1 peptidoglycan DD-metalloendopeptidase family protein [Catellatospora sp. KI3]
MLARTLRTAVVTAVAAAAVLVAASPASAAPVYKLPFPCGETWGGSTRSDHSPVNAIDFNRTDDVDDWVIASAPGTVETVADQGATGYGKYIKINHGGGHSTYYAHLNSWWVSVGSVVGYGTVIGTVGSTGNSSGPHLHYEQRANGTPNQVAFDGVTALYYGAKNYVSSNACGGTNRTGAGWIDTSTSGPQNVYSGAGTTFSVVGSLPDGAYVTVWCQAVGQSVTGKWGTSNVWNRIDLGRFVPDVNTYTGYTGFIPSVPRC